jgi:hypothetical protein
VFDIVQKTVAGNPKDPGQNRRRSVKPISRFPGLGEGLLAEILSPLLIPAQVKKVVVDPQVVFSKKLLAVENADGSRIRRPWGVVLHCIQAGHGKDSSPAFFVFLVLRWLVAGHGLSVHRDVADGTLSTILDDRPGGGVGLPSQESFQIAPKGKEDLPRRIELIRK